MDDEKKGQRAADTVTAAVLSVLFCLMCRLWPVLLLMAFAVPDEPGGLSRLLSAFTAAELNIEYMYAFLGGKKSDHAYMIFRVADIEKESAALSQQGIHPVDQDEMSNL